MVAPLPKSWLIHSIEYKELTGKDNYNNPIYADPIEIEFVRVDNSTQFSRNAQQQTIEANAVIFADAVHTTPFIDFKEESKIIFKGEEMTIKKAITFYQPKADEIRHCEIEVI